MIYSTNNLDRSIISRKNIIFLFVLPPSFFSSEMRVQKLNAVAFGGREIVVRRVILYLCLMFNSKSGGGREVELINTVLNYSGRA